jgi:hypothetical protein
MATQSEQETTFYGDQIYLLIGILSLIIIDRIFYKIYRDK